MKGIPMTTWTITLYQPDNDKYLEFDLESDTKPTEADVLEHIEIFVGAQDNVTD
jgi:hypothetical protein